MLQRLSDKSIKLCGKGNCCPIITKLDENTYEVEDDNGNKIIVKKGDLALVTDAMSALDGSPIVKEQLICG